MARLQAALSNGWSLHSIGRRGVLTIPNVLIAHHDAYTRKLIEATLEGEGFEIRSVADGIDALARIRHAPFDLVVIAKDLPELDGPTVVKAIGGLQRKDLPRIIMLGATADELAPEIARHVHASLGLPFRPIMLLVSATELLSVQPVSELARDSRSHLRVVT